MNEIVIATANSGKFREIKEIFGSLDVKLLSLADFPGFPEIEEDGNSFEANAEIKARKVRAITGKPAIGDDSGLVVDQLDGAPGIFSARYSGENATDEENNQKLLAELKEYSHPHTARFVCVAVYYDGKDVIIRKGTIDGKIIDTPRGTNGFGYDPLFVPDGLDKTHAEISAELKNKISHRAKAFLKMREFLEKKFYVNPQEDRK